ncbi:acyltransferase family protein [Vibrio crassostreae]|uniref:acyltransferase family protein n=1 Tax=Vibrio crassostreae TaxID=246167 RepID=UPI0010506396|nr:acyltransferase family protein [Vibrio crassostreae]TCT71099.1 peptidoglycan/LPS O-acetylase OafA/YrhL [Vibrio crassostreae]CAK2197196.1 exopolysaccharide production protein ExoZ [Vibrio crassostreae]CAK2402277.1 exopolysaccharide production protein ExoZ [Vibrio crassostreae]CAK2907177.1 exopolysaccharide production protein ExoZ [Vibrio crassostreae]
MSRVISYKPEIDALRALAVALVIFDHIKIEFFSGGYVGVDVFFVISGYLITSIVRKEILNQNFSFALFYKKRILRLAPALYFMLFVVLICSLMLLLPHELERVSLSSIYSNFFMANFYMWKEVGGYFGSNEGVPLLHLWSLSVEEQFYIFWPIILITSISIFNERKIIGFVAFLLLISLVLSEIATNKFFVASYYLMPSRAYELILGAFIVFIPKFNFNLGITRFFKILGLIIILYSGITFTPDTLFPGINALYPCLGASLFVYFSQFNNEGVSESLQAKFIIYIGKISYPLYLWHWPVICFLLTLGMELSTLNRVLVILITLVLSCITYEYVEKPAKKLNKLNFSKVAFLLFIIPSSLIFIFYIYTLENNGLPWRFEKNILLQSEVIHSFPDKERTGCHNSGANTINLTEYCKLGNTEKEGIDFLLIGDSHANHFSSFVDELARDADLVGFDVTQSSTVYLPNVKMFGEHGYLSSFKERNDRITELLRQDKFTKVILAGFYSSTMRDLDIRLGTYQSRLDIFKRSFEDALDIASHGNRKIYIIEEIPTHKKGIERCQIQNMMYQRNKECFTYFDDYINQVKDWNEIKESLALKYENLTFITPSKLLCDEQHCKSEFDGITVYRDWNHLNSIGARTMAKHLINSDQNPLK